MLLITLYSAHYSGFPLFRTAVFAFCHFILTWQANLEYNGSKNCLAHADLVIWGDDLAAICGVCLNLVPLGMGP
jgi:hypothetical protein